MRQPSGGAHARQGRSHAGLSRHAFLHARLRQLLRSRPRTWSAARRGKGKGFYLQMAGFAAGRLQTGGRAAGVAQAALERTAAYANERKQFGRPIGEFQLTQYKLGRMAVDIAAARQLTYAAARVDGRGRIGDARAGDGEALRLRRRQRVTQEGQLLHGGWGYAEEFPISRYVVDALVLPIFEGVKPILELKVIARVAAQRARLAPGDGREEGSGPVRRRQRKHGLLRSLRRSRGHAMVEHCFKVIVPEVEKRAGRIVKYMGDGFLAVFEGAVGAVDAAAAVHTSLADDNATRPEGARVRIHSGVSVGPVVVRGRRRRLRRHGQRGGARAARRRSGSDLRDEGSHRRICRPTRRRRLAAWACSRCAARKTRSSSTR